MQPWQPLLSDARPPNVASASSATSSPSTASSPKQEPATLSLQTLLPSSTNTHPPTSPPLSDFCSRHTCAKPTSVSPRLCVRDTLPSATVRSSLKIPTG